MKFLVVYPLPWKLQTSATYQNIAGIPVTASYPATNAQIAPSLGRNLSAGPTATATLALIPANSQFEDRLQQVDLRFTRTFQASKLRVRGNFDIYNILNETAVLSDNLGYGSQWLTPFQILPGACSSSAFNSISESAEGGLLCRPHLSPYRRAPVGRTL